MPSVDRGGNSSILSSDWTGLSPHLIAKFFQVQRAEGGVRWEPVPDTNQVWAPITDGSIEQTQNWQSPFENIGVDGKLSTFSSMLQSGGFLSILNALQQKAGEDSTFGKALGVVSGELKDLVGATGVTKLNSTQIYTGSPPMKLSFTAHFRALIKAEQEVRRPLDQLAAWAFPKHLAPDGLLTNTAKSGPAVRSVYASEAPAIVGMQYADALFMPMVIEHIDMPLTAPRDKDGHVIHSSVRMSLSSLTALDQADWWATSLQNR